MHTASLAGITYGSEDKPRLCEAAVERGRVPAACEPSMAQPAFGGTLSMGTADVTYGVSALLLQHLAHVCVWVCLCANNGNR